MKNKYLTPEEKIKKALKMLKKAYREKAQLEIEGEYDYVPIENISEEDAIKKYHVTSLEVEQFRKNGLEFFVEDGQRFYNDVDMSYHVTWLVDGTDHTYSEKEAIYNFNLKPSMIKKMRKEGLEVLFEQDGDRFYKAIDFDSYYDKVCALKANK